MGELNKPTELREVYLSDILVSRDYHSRDLLKDRIIKRYENLYKAEPEGVYADDFEGWVDNTPEEEHFQFPNVPPLDVALINDVLVLFDGFHRFEAMNGVGMTSAAVRIHHGRSYVELPYLGARNNLTHGLPMTNRDVRKIVFRSYVKSKNNKDGKRYKSYREIASDFGSLYSYNTFRNWMRKDFPSVFRAMSSEEEGEIELKQLDPDAEHLKHACAELSNVAKRYASIKGDEHKVELINACEETLKLLLKNTPPDYKRYEKDEEDSEF